jgi:cytochrome c-type biogenesis protein CcmH
MTCCDYDNAAGFLIEDNAIIAHTEPCTILAFQFFDVAQTCCRKGVEFSADALACLRRQFQPLPRRSGGEDNVAHYLEYRIMRYFRQVLFAIVMSLICLSPAHAVQPDEIMADPAKESRARDLSRELRCMVCQNQSIDDSEAPLARDLRLLVRERIAAGDSDAQVMDFLVARYGEFVLLKPRLKSHTLLLWLLPPFALVGGGLALWMHNRRRTKSAATEDQSLFKLSADEEARLERLIAAEPPAEKVGHAPR